MSGQKRLIQNDLEAQGKGDKVNDALSGDLNEQADGKEIPCKK